MLNRSKLWAVGLLVAIGVVGFATGAATMNYAAKDNRSERARCSYSGILSRELGLTDAQRDSVRAVLRRYRPETRALYDRIRPEMDSLRARIRADISALLTPSQREAYERFLAREREERAHRDSARAAQGATQ
jgi:Spy/CpxP family protein refolding chaperone